MSSGKITMTLHLDEADYSTIQNEIARCQRLSRQLSPDEPTIVPEGESCLAGSIIAESIRNLEEYRSIFSMGV